MKLKSLSESLPNALYGIDGPFKNILNKLKDPGRNPKNYKGIGLHYTTGGGNQNNPAIANPRHREFFNTPRDGASAESKSARKSNDPIKQDDGGWKRWVDRFNMKLINIINT